MHRSRSQQPCTQAPGQHRRRSHSRGGSRQALRGCLCWSAARSQGVGQDSQLRLGDAILRKLCLGALAATPQGAPVASCALCRYARAASAESCLHRARAVQQVTTPARARRAGCAGCLPSESSTLSCVELQVVLRMEFISARQSKVVVLSSCDSGAQEAELMRLLQCVVLLVWCGFASTELLLWWEVRLHACIAPCGTVCC